MSGERVLEYNSKPIAMNPLLYIICPDSIWVNAFERQPMLRSSGCILIVIGILESSGHQK